MNPTDPDPIRPVETDSEPRPGGTGMVDTAMVFVRLSIVLAVTALVVMVALVITAREVTR